MLNNTYLIKEARAWLKRAKGPDEIVRIERDTDNEAPILTYHLYVAYGGDYLGRILFDKQLYWIYDGDILSVNEQEQLAKFILNYVETL
ncbi:hypothetical protein [Mucilaginibacter sp.]|uniref:hypothetical protein n=1 Tax=Mucilaginibacter sp. TaxID=1882438 RepID=UPI003D09BDB2